jgi:hypothetical protein
VIFSPAAGLSPFEGRAFLGGSAGSGLAAGAWLSVGRDPATSTDRTVERAASFEGKRFKF